MKLTLARALRYKKRVVESIKKLETDIQQCNSIVEGEERETDITLALRQRSAWVKHLIALKLSLQNATGPIQKLVFELAEAKSEIAFYQRLSTENGMVKSRYGEPSLKYEAKIRKGERDKIVKELQDQIDRLQTKIDAHNATVEIDVPDAELP